MDSADAVVIGAGVIGLAVARELAARGHETLILESAARYGTGVSARNSEVIHAGLYYAPGSLKARLCTAGRDQLYAYCARRAIGHRRCGKLVVATDTAQLAQLARLAANATANGVNLDTLDPGAVQALEPELACVAALYSPLTGVLDVPAFLSALLADAEHDGALLACGSRVTRLVLEERGVAIGVNGAEPQLRARRLFNCAALDAPAVAHLLEGYPKAHIPQVHLTKGSYFTLSGRTPFRHLTYPLPDAGSLGIHLTLDLAGRARFGPDVEPVAECDFRVDPRRAPAFGAAIRRYWPGLTDDRLEPGYAGIRPRIAAPGEPLPDFRIDDAGRHGIPGVVNLFGIESPGLTASLALAAEAVSRLA